MSEPDSTMQPEQVAKVWRAVNAETSVYVTPLGAIAIEQWDGVQTKTITFWVDDLTALGEALIPLLDVAEAIRQRGKA